ncbi:Erythrocyte membrane protein band 4.1 like 5 [Paragonimus heterotremus]|uniref:Erythrocyte membrane protein band 4.1 like 5 n=1 Tax=Paragonimus heterotremus TaxID=100268 RepID=A0A8J4WG79_9TREM|nr:Erythrocyte membrane protein band 4.1 like 5 [Paragonimus heterotremus]
MAAIIRFFSRRFRRKKSEPAHSHLEEVASSSQNKKKKKSDLDCRVTYLDGTEQTFYLPKNALASELFDIAFAYVGLNEEKDYFGLKYFGKYTMWLDPTKGIQKQCKSKPPFQVSLLVKFFASDPHNLRDEYTRYLVVLQLREYIHTGKLPCTDLRLAAELSALLLQAEFGDFDPRQHTPVFVSTFRFLPEEQQTEQFELDVLEQYRKLKNRNLTPSLAESMYLERVRLIPDYGVDMHIVKGKNNEEYKLGLTPTGILVYEGNNKIGLFFWPNILKIEMNRSRLKILVTDEDEATRKVTEHAFCFVLPDNRTCKNLWKSAVEHHAFFRLTDRSQPPPKRRQLFRLRSRFYASLNTEYQMHNLNLFGSSSFRRRKNKSASEPSTPIPTSPNLSGGRSVNVAPGATQKPSSFRRVPSKRFSSRSSFSSRSGFDERRARRHRIPATTEKTEADYFNDARTVVAVERACRRDPSWTPPSPRSSNVREPTLRNRPAPTTPSTSTVTSFQPAVRVTPQLGRGQFPLQPPKPPRKLNGVVAPTKVTAVPEECFEATV